MTPNKLKEQWLTQDEGQIDTAIGALLEHEHGRRFLWWLLQIGKVQMQPYSRNALDTAFACGELNVGNQILDRIVSVSAEGYVNMMKEKESERRTRADQLNGTDDRNDSSADRDNGPIGGTDAYD